MTANIIPNTKYDRKGTTANHNKEESKNDSSQPKAAAIMIIMRTGSFAMVKANIINGAPNANSEQLKNSAKYQYHRCQLYGHASANCNANPRCVKCLVPHWTRDCPLSRDSAEKPSCVNCGQNHTANYRGCPKAPKFISKNRPNTKRPSYAPPLPGIWEAQRPPPPGPPPPASAIAGSSSFGEDIQTVMAVLRAVSSLEISEFAAQLQACKNTEKKLLVLVRYHHMMATYSYERTGRTLEEAVPALYYNRLLHCCPITIPPLVNMEATGCRLAMTGHSTIVIVSVYLPSPKPLLRSDLRALLGLGDAVILFGDFNSKNPRWGCAVMDENGEKLDRLQDRLEFEIIAPSTATYFPHNDTYRTSTLDIALTKGDALNLNSIEPLHRLLSDHRPVLLKMGPPDGGRPVSTVKITDWKRVSTAFEKIDTPPLNSIADDISTIEQIDHAIGAFTSHVRTVVEKCEQEVPASSDRRKFPPDILELIRAKNAALRRASAYPTPEYRSRARALQREVKARV
ncbi:RNA-directed DNA polymerase from mobile element jockey [Eumeta japonica]|uniref:RNA-directed DNA polymerase from mobile element jockey n=1 Tax=Eumeta variegata TaxID=151549 RepID=A0A4C1WNP6_EUMVA|nr:RNA-directed DNA polymerase from mobile element jockey [Eumeta japonica]